MPVKLQSIQDKAAHQERCRKAAVKAYSELSPKEQITANLLHMLAHEELHLGAPAPIFSKMAKTIHDRDLSIGCRGGDTASSESLLEQIGKLYGRNVSLKKGHATLTARVQELEAQLAAAQKPTGTMHVTEQGLEGRNAEGKLTWAVGQLPRLPRERRPGDFIREMSTKLQGYEPRAARYEAIKALKQMAAEVDAHCSLDAGEKIHSIVEEAVSGIKGSQTFADLSLQSAIDDLRQRVNRAEDAVKYAFSQGSKGTIAETKELEGAIKRGIIDGLQPGGVLYNAIKLNRK